MKCLTYAHQFFRTFCIKLLKVIKTIAYTRRISILFEHFLAGISWYSSLAGFLSDCFARLRALHVSVQIHERLRAGIVRWSRALLSRFYGSVHVHIVWRLLGGRTEALWRSAMHAVQRAAGQTAAGKRRRRRGPCRKGSSRRSWAPPMRGKELKAAPKQPVTARPHHSATIQRAQLRRRPLQHQGAGAGRGRGERAPLLTRQQHHLTNRGNCLMQNIFTNYESLLYFKTVFIFYL